MGLRRIPVNVRNAPVYLVDDYAVRRGAEQRLQSTGYRVETFASARAFLERGSLDALPCLNAYWTKVLLTIDQRSYFQTVLAIIELH
jgi:hypothetical protein